MKQFKIMVWYGANKTEIILTANNVAQAMLIGRKICPAEIVMSASEVKQKK